MMFQPTLALITQKASCTKKAPTLEGFHVSGPGRRYSLDTVLILFWVLEIILGMWSLSTMGAA
eukprot:9483572-Pyramimonas_sp.AAC.1